MSTIDPIYLEQLDQLRGISSYRVTTAAKARSTHDAALELRTPAGRYRLFVTQVRSHLSHETADHIVARALRDPDHPSLLFAPSVGTPLAAKLAEAGINYLDRAGNCHLALGSLYIHVEGRSGAARAGAGKGLRSAGYQVLFAYLAEPALLDETVRGVAAAAGVSRQPVSDTKRRLLDDEYIVATKSGVRWAPRRQQDALTLWLHGYETVVRRSLWWGAYRTPDASAEQLERRLVAVFGALDVALRWGGGAAAYRLTGHYRGERTTVHLAAGDRPRLGALQEQVRALSDARGELVLMQAFGALNDVAGAETVDPLLVYSELLQERNDRAREAAQELLETQIHPRWSRA